MIMCTLDSGIDAALGNKHTLITLLRVPIDRPNWQYKASTAEIAEVRYT